MSLLHDPHNQRNLPEYSFRHHDPRQGLSLRWNRLSRWILLASFLLYLGVGVWLARGEGFMMGDSLSRVQSAQAVLYSRYPHLAAMGFVFTPLSTLAELPFVALSPLLPGMTKWGLAAVIVSAGFMAAAVQQLWKITGDRGLSLPVAALMILVFALHPMVVLYGASGMSEAPFCFAMLLSTRRLIRWLSTDDVHDLVGGGVGLALAFLARYDALVVAAVATLMVGLLSWRRSRPGRADFHPGYAVVDMIVFAAPLALAFLVWVASSWLATGDLLAQFTSAYGNTAIIDQSGGVASGVTALGDSLMRTWLQAPLLILLLPVVGWLSWRRRDPEPLIAPVLFGTVLAFQMLTAMMGGAFGFLRFFMVGAILVAVLLIQLAPPRGHLAARRTGRGFTPRHSSTPLPATLLILLSVLVFGGHAITWQGMSSLRWAPQEYALAELFPGAESSPSEEAGRREILRTFSTERRLAQHLDSLDLEDGEVLTDTTFAFAVLTASENPKQFTVPSDSDFIIRLEEPAVTQVRYILTVAPEGRGANDPVNRRYPSIYADGADLATLELEIPNEGSGQPDYRLYRVMEP
ncbi:hypothetical protein COCCU_10440 [Corynebacterium occultum]|uniref:Uncharacterized protein n=1 Tax=Corynebacterium occultum TaxID=2675219 RepID=A0A6B8W7U9_9CORY|nr:glycosyltransferase family 39 protein [Corynebacterium occultum]QGU08007.1 hypothetical protein COCCU_10440 [Corynebacterium occultum]